MQYSLLSRFQGFLLGGVLGETVALRWSNAHSPAMDNNQEGAIPRLTPSSLPLSDLLYASTKRLIQSQMVNQGNASISPNSPSEGVTARVSPGSTGSASIPLAQQVWGLQARAIVCCLPLLLFFHENSAQLQQQVRQSLTHSMAPELETEGRVIAETVVCIFQEHRQPLTLIPTVLRRLKSVAPAIASALNQTQELLANRVGLEAAVTVLTPNAANASKPIIPIALALYCWLSTPECFALSLLRAQQIAKGWALTSVLTGVFAGAYNGQLGVPLAWQRQLQGIAVEGQNGQLCSLRTRAMNLAEDLLAVWSGCYQLQPETVRGRWAQAAIAAPDVIRTIPRLPFYCGGKKQP